MDVSLGPLEFKQGSLSRTFEGAGSSLRGEVKGPLRPQLGGSETTTAIVFGHTDSLVELKEGDEIDHKLAVMTGREMALMSLRRVVCPDKGSF